MTEIRAYQKTLPKERRYKIGDLLARIDLKRSSYYDECERMKNPYDKYVNVKKLIMEIAQSYVVRDRYTAGYRRIQKKLDQRNAHLAGETVRKLMAQLKVQVAIYNQNRNGKYYIGEPLGKPQRTCLSGSLMRPSLIKSFTPISRRPNWLINKRFIFQ